MLSMGKEIKCIEHVANPYFCGKEQIRWLCWGTSRMLAMGKAVLDDGVEGENISFKLPDMYAAQSHRRICLNLWSFSQLQTDNEKCRQLIAMTEKHACLDGTDASNTVGKMCGQMVI